MVAHVANTRRRPRDSKQFETGNETHLILQSMQCSRVAHRHACMGSQWKHMHKCAHAGVKHHQIDSTPPLIGNIVHRCQRHKFRLEQSAHHHHNDLETAPKNSNGHPNAPIGDPTPTEGREDREARGAGADDTRCRVVKSFVSAYLQPNVSGYISVPGNTIAGVCDVPGDDCAQRRHKKTKASRNAMLDPTKSASKEYGRLAG